MAEVTAVERLVALVRRDLGADEVRLLDCDEKEEGLPEGATVLRGEVNGARRIVVIFRSTPADLEARERRLEMLIESFGETLSRAPSTSRPSPSVSLHLELENLVMRAGATDALVIDARSPIVWGASADEMSLRATYETDVINLPERDRTTTQPQRISSAEIISWEGGDPAERAEREELGPRDSISYRAISAVRALPMLSSLHRGGHLYHTVREDNFGLLARSFASIYVLIVVFDGPYDEIRAERAFSTALPVIERLVLALPPLDPQPIAGAMAIRRRRR